MTRPIACLSLLIAALCWGSGNVANKTVLEHLGPITVVGLRCLLAALVLVPLALPELRRTVPDGWWKSALGVSALLALAMALQQTAYVTSTVTNASFLVNTATIMTPLLVWLLLGHRPGAVIVFAAFLSVAGTFLMAGGSFAPSNLKSGDVICVLSAAVYAAWMVALGEHVVRYGQPLATAAAQFAVTAILMTPAGFFLEQPDLAAILDALPELVMLGIIATAVPFGLMSMAQRHVEASTAAVLVSAESLFGAALAHLLLGERTSAMGFAGAALILTAIVMVAAGERSAPRKRAGSGHPLQDWTGEVPRPALPEHRSQPVIAYVHPNPPLLLIHPIGHRHDHVA
jgi:drug/metabolite transporter (DMT)-like permease